MLEMLKNWFRADPTGRIIDRVCASEGWGVERDGCARTIHFPGGLAVLVTHPADDSPINFYGLSSFFILDRELGESLAANFNDILEAQNTCHRWALRKCGENWRLILNAHLKPDGFTAELFRLACLVMLNFMLPVDDGFQEMQDQAEVDKLLLARLVKKE